MICIGFSFPLMTYVEGDFTISGVTFSGRVGRGIWGVWYSGTVAGETCSEYASYSGETKIVCSNNDGSSSISGSGIAVCDSDNTADFGWLCTTQWLYTVSFALSVLGCCTTIGGAFGPKVALAGAAAINFCSGLFCMITASYVTASYKIDGEFVQPWSSLNGSDQTGAPYKANFSYAALWIGWLLGWLCAAICAYAFTQGDGEKRQEVVVIDHGRGETFTEERIVHEATVAV